jgi:phenylacetate-CoA ligase
LRIRRQAARHGLLDYEALGDLNRTLFQRRVREAIAHFPSYADHVRNHRGSLPPPAELIDADELPIWTRRNQRELFDPLHPPDDAAYIHQTSGSIGMAVRFYVTRESYEWRTAVSDRSYAVARAEEGRRSFYIWATDQESPPLLRRVKRRIDTGLQRRHFYDAFQRFGDEQRAECCREINRLRPDAIVGYTGLLVDLARYVRDHPDALRWKARTLVNAAEGLNPGQRDLLERHLADELFLSYGSREFMNVGIECQHHNGYHIVTDNLFVEIIGDDGRKLPHGETGRIVITDLRNAATPFIRYEIGDYGTMAPPEPCACGRPFPLLASVDGRMHDVIHTPDGRRLTALYITYALRDCHWIEGHQAVQNDRSRVLIRLLTTEEPTTDRMAFATEKLRKKLGEAIAIDYERVDALSREATGKIPPVISSIADP